MSRPQNSFSTLSWPEKVKNDPKINSKSNVRIESNKEYESCSTTWVDPKTVIEHYPDPKNRPFGS